jgi:hypothetical protein
MSLQRIGTPQLADALLDVRDLAVAADERLLRFGGYSIRAELASAILSPPCIVCEDSVTGDVAMWLFQKDPSPCVAVILSCLRSETFGSYTERIEAKFYEQRGNAIDKSCRAANEDRRLLRYCEAIGCK